MTSKSLGFVTSQNELTDSTLIITIVSKPTALVFSSYMTLLILKYGSRMELTQEACLRVEQEGISFREAQRIVESDLFLDEYPRWDLGTLHWPVILTKCSCMPRPEDGRRQNACAT